MKPGCYKLHLPKKVPKYYCGDRHWFNDGDIIYVKGTVKCHWECPTCKGLVNTEFGATCLSWGAGHDRETIFEKVGDENVEILTNGYRIYRVKEKELEEEKELYRLIRL